MACGLLHVQYLSSSVMLCSWHTQRKFAAFFFKLRYQPWFVAMLFQLSHAHCQCFFVTNSHMSWFYHSTTRLLAQFLHDFVLQLVETAACFTICMIQHVFSILIYSFNRIFIKLSWIEDKQQQPMMSEMTSLTTSTVILVLLNGKMIAHKIELKISHFIKLNYSRPVSLQCVWSTGWPADQ